MTLENAVKKYQPLLTEFSAGVNPNESKRKLREDVTLGQLFERYLKLHAKSHLKSDNRSEKDYELYLKKPFGDRRLKDIDRDMVKKLHIKIASDIQKRRAKDKLEWTVRQP